MIEAGTYPVRHDAPIPEGEFSVYSVRSEEMLPDPELPAQVERFNAMESPSRMAWGTLDDLVPYFQQELDGVNAPPEEKVASEVEWNPTQTGTLVTRARLKHLARKAERTYYSAERYFALRGLEGLEPPCDALESIWLGLPLLFFHDVITGTLCDPAATEMEELASEMVNRVRTFVKNPLFHPNTGREPGFSLFNPDTSGFPVEVEVPDEFTQAQPIRDKGKTLAVYPQVRRETFNVRNLRALHADSTVRPKLQRLATVPDPCPLAVESLHCGDREVTLEALPEATRNACNRFFNIEWDNDGLISIRDLTSRKAISTQSHIRPNALILEEDTGDPWGTRSFQRERTEIYHNTKLAGAWQGKGFIELSFAGTFLENQEFAKEVDPNVFGLEWTQTVRLVDNSPRIDFVTEIYWKSVNRRIRVAFPTPTQSDVGWYGIPCGYIRRPRYEMTDNRLYSPNGDWPALDFFATSPGTVPGLVLMNRGAVSARLEDGVMLLSLLRSPGFGSCLERYAQDYALPHTGIRDPGYHCFEYAVAALNSEADLPSAAAHAQAYNARPLCLPGGADKLPGITVNPPQIEVLALKPAFEGQGIILRLLNNGDTCVNAELELPEAALKAECCNLIEERQSSMEIQQNRLRIALRPWEIMTIRLKTKRSHQ